MDVIVSLVQRYDWCDLVDYFNDVLGVIWLIYCGWLVDWLVGWLVDVMVSMMAERERVCVCEMDWSIGPVKEV